MGRTKKVRDDDSEEELDEYQIDQVKKTYVLLNNHWDTIESNLPKHSKELIAFIARYRNKNISLLESPYPQKGLYWLPICNKILYITTTVDEEAFVKDVLTIRGWEGYEDTYLADKAPHIMMLLIARYFYMNKMTREFEIMKHYIGYAHYWGALNSMFKTFINLDVMMYTMQEMSYKSRLKSLGSIDKWVTEGVSDTLETYKKRFLRGSDFELHYIQEKIRSKFKSALKTIFRAQQQNEAKGNRVFISQNKVKGGEDGEDIQVENTYGMAQALQIANGYTTKFFSNPIDESCLKQVTGEATISARDLRNVLSMIAADRNNIEDLRKFYQSMFYTFLESGKYSPKDIGTLRFYAEMDRLYKPGNTNDPNKLFIKEILDKWLAIGSKTFRTSNRTATLTNFRKSIYVYFVLKIMKDK